MSEIENIFKKMSWGTELWDQYDNLSAHTYKGIQLLDKFTNFVRDRIQIEAEYAVKLKKLAKNYQPKKIEDEEHEPTSLQAFCNMLREVNGLAVHHEVFGESLKQRIVQGITELSSKLQQERKACLNDYAKLQLNLNQQLAELERTKRHYEKSYHESKKAIENYKKADLDLNLSRAEVYRCNNLMHTKMQEADDAKLDYAKQLQKTNSFQAQHYAEFVPAVFNRLQLLDQKRSSGIGDFIISMANVELAMMPLITNCLQDIRKAGEEIDEEQDAMLIIERFKTDLKIPSDMVFEDLAKQDEERNLPLKSTKNTNNFKKDVALFKIYKSIKQRKITEACVTFKNFLTTSHENLSVGGDLTSNQRKRLNLRIGELHKKIKKETDAYIDLMKLKQAFENNTATGDPERVTEQLNQMNAKIEKLKADLKKLQQSLENAVQERPHGISKENICLVRTEIDDTSENADTIPESNVSKVQKWLEHITEDVAANPESSLGASRTSTIDSGKGSVSEIPLGVTEVATNSLPATE